MTSKSVAKSDIAIAYSGAHPAHQKLFGDCDALSIKMLGEWSAGKRVPSMQKFLSYIRTALQLRLSDNRVVAIEGTTPTVLMAPVIKLLNPKPKSVIALCADDTFYRTFVEGNVLNRFVVRLGFRYVSGIIAIGDFVAKIAGECLRSIPTEIRYPPLREDSLTGFADIMPSINAHTALLIGGGNQYVKGVDIALSSIERLRKIYTDASLTILGFNGITEQPGVNAPGPVPDIRSYLTSSSVLIHAVRGDAFPVAVVEAMLAGVVPFVSEWTGVRVLAEQIDSKLVVPLQADEFSKRIASFWSLTPEEQQEISDKCKQVAQEFVHKVSLQPSLKRFIETFAK